MSEIVLVRYTVGSGQEDRNAESVRAVYAELGAERPEGFRYATLREGSAFTHLAVHDAGVTRWRSSLRSRRSRNVCGSARWRGRTSPTPS